MQSTNKKKITGPKLTVGKKAQSPTSALMQVKNQLKELKMIDAEIASMKHLYAKRDELMQELLPLFIETTADEFVIKREIKIGSTKYRFSPFFYDEKKATVVTKVWKSAAFESGRIE